MATNGRFIGNDPLTEFNNFAIPVTNANNNKDYRIEKAQLKQLVDNANVVSKDVKSGGKVGNELIASQNFVIGKVDSVNNSLRQEIQNNSVLDQAFAVKYGKKIIGRNLLDVLDVSSARAVFDKIRAMNGDYSLLMLGDYVDIPSITVGGTTYQNVSGNLRAEIQGFDHYYNVGDSPTGRGVLFGFRNCVTTRPMNTAHTNENGYYGSELRVWLNGDFATGLENAIGTLKPVRRLAEKHNPSSWWTNWVSEKCFLPTEVEVWGHQIWGNAGYSTGASIQYPIYAIDPDRRLKNHNGSRMWWWTGTSCVKGDNEQPSSTSFCYVNGSGYASYYGAGNSHGVSPAFYI